MTVSVVVPAPVVTIDASPKVVFQGGTTVITWDVQNIIAGDAGCTASAVPAQPSWSGSQPTSGNVDLQPDQTVTYTLSCTNPGGTDSESVTVTVPFLEEVIPE